MSEISLIHRRLMVQYSTAAYCLCSEDHFVYKYLYQTGALHRLFRLPYPVNTPGGRMKNMILRHPAVRFVRRSLGISNVIELPTGTVVAFYDKVYRYDRSNHSGVAEETVSFMPYRFHAPLKNGIGINPENNCAYFGEYQNTRPYAVKIMRLYDDGRQADICYTFPQGQVKHIHSITWDAFRKRLWIATGDANAEAALYYTEDDFKNVHCFNGGSQFWRMVSLLVTEHALYWGGDAGKDATAEDVNCIFRWNFDQNYLEKIQEIGNPAYYSVFLDDGGMLIGTTYEPGMKQQTPLEAALWYSSEGSRWEKMCALPYKNLHKSHRTQYAILNLPQGVLPHNMILITPLNTTHWDFDLIKISKSGAS